MGKIFLYTMLSLLVLTILGFVFGLHQLAYTSGFFLGAFTLGVGLVYSSRDDDKYRSSDLLTQEAKKKK